MILSYSNIGHTSWLNLKATNLVKTLKLFLHWLKWRLLRYHSFLLLCRWSNCVYKWRKNFLLIKTEVPRHDWMVSYVGNVSYSGVRFILGTDYWRNGIKLKAIMKSRKIVCTCYRYIRNMILVNVLHDHKNSIRAWNNFSKDCVYYRLFLA